MAHCAYHPHETMENSSLFDLNEAIGDWRERLLGLRSLGADDLEELEDHLRESVAELEAEGLSQEEAFLVATERLGSDQRLADEYAKTNATRIWTGRAVWMLGGVVAGMVMKALVETGLGFVYHGSLWLGLNARMVVALDFLSQWTITAAWVGLCCWFLAHPNRWLKRAISKGFQHPVWTGVALVLALFGLRILSLMVGHWCQQHLHPVAARSAADSAIFHTWGFSAMLLSRLVWAAAIPLLAAYLWKATRTAAPSFPALPNVGLQPNERALAAQLEAQGLSRSESHLVIAWRRGHRATPTEAKARFASGTCVERGFWMIVGMIAYGMLREFVDEPSWTLLPSARSLAPLWQHFNGLMALCLPLALAGGAIAAFWKGATGSQKANGWLRRVIQVFEQSPVRGASLFTAFAVLSLGLPAYFFQAQPADAQPRFLSHGRIEIIWWTCRNLLMEFLLPAILLVWAGNRYQTGSKSA